jgi:hypothetical protein
MTALVATAWTTAGDTSPMRVAPTSPVPIAERVAAVAEALAPSFIKIGSEIGPRTKHPESLITPLRELAEQAADRGTRVAIETMPFSIISTVSMTTLQRSSAHCSRTR